MHPDFVPDLRQNDMHWREGAPHRMKTRRAPQREIDHGPTAGGRPAIVEHPEAGAGAAEHLVPERFDVFPQRFALDQAAPVGEFLHGHGADIPSQPFLRDLIDGTRLFPAIDGIIVILPGEGADLLLPFRQAGVHGGQRGWPKKSAFVWEAADHGAILVEIDVEKADGPGMLVARVVLVRGEIIG